METAITLKLTLRADGEGWNVMKNIKTLIERNDPGEMRAFALRLLNVRQSRLDKRSDLFQTFL